ncbi:MAG: hypothetical protein ACYC5O_08550 [Anaerolineae bacterium]
MRLRRYLAIGALMSAVAFAGYAFLGPRNARAGLGTRPADVATDASTSATPGGNAYQHAEVAAVALTVGNGPLAGDLERTQAEMDEISRRMVQLMADMQPGGAARALAVGEALTHTQGARDAGANLADSGEPLAREKDVVAALDAMMATLLAMRSTTDVMAGYVASTGATSGG